MTDKETLDVYARKTDEYAALTNGKDPLLTAFIADLPKGAHVLDLGCGPGTSAGLMAQQGMSVLATDASPEMIALAAQHDGVTAQIASFDDISGTHCFDGIWANFSLLHAERDALPRHLTALHQALKPGGLFHIALKTGSGTKRDTLGRRYTYYLKDELLTLLTNCGFTVQNHTTGREKGLDGTAADWIAVRAHG